jgi:hypothetical protein
MLILIRTLERGEKYWALNFHEVTHLPRVGDSVQLPGDTKFFRVMAVVHRLTPGIDTDADLWAVETDLKTVLDACIPASPSAQPGR